MEIHPPFPRENFFYCVLINAGKRASQLSPHIRTPLLRFLGESHATLRGGRAGGRRQLEPQSRRNFQNHFRSPSICWDHVHWENTQQLHTSLTPWIEKFRRLIRMLYNDAIQLHKLQKV
jgi:hypothetical protein